MAEKLKFKTEVSKLLDIVVHSLYSERHIFLRELISNSSDACDKLRYMALIKPEIAKGDGEFKIELLPNAEKNTLTIRDNGIGMNKTDLKNDLGTIARSGSQEFLNRLEESDKSIDLIGQFGVGFYSAFMVADKVEVRSRKAGEELGWIWKSDGKGSYSIDEAEDIPRGTSIILYLKDESKEFSDPTRIRHIVRTYSDHVPYPVILAHKGERETINSASALWTRNKAEITDEQYKEFYHHVAHAFDEPWHTIHYKAEGAIEYTSLLFIPTKQPFDLFQPDKKTPLKLYVNRVFITDEVKDLLPNYLRFIRGVVDSPDIQLNISREMLQHSALVKKIGNGLVRKILSELKTQSKETSNYNEFISSFGAVLKEGIYEDRERKEDVAALCRFKSSMRDELISLDEYIEKMHIDQKAIYYITGDDIDVLKKNPQLEGFRAKGIEVLLLTDPIDEFWPQALFNYKDKPIKPVGQVGDDLEKIDFNEDVNKEEPAPEEEIKSLTEALKEIYGEEIKEVKTTNHLTSSPVCLTTGEGEMSIHLERLMKNHQQQTLYNSSRLLLINPRHQIIKALAKASKDKKNSQEFKDAAFILLDQAKIIEGEAIKDPAEFGLRVSRFMIKGLNF
jgi:molecular chaperone HtpG